LSYLKNKNNKRSGGIAQVAEQLSASVRPWVQFPELKGKKKKIEKIWSK
jgi:hypothetical protein